VRRRQGGLIPEGMAGAVVSMFGRGNIYVAVAQLHFCVSLDAAQNGRPSRHPNDCKNAKLGAPLIPK